MNPLPGRLERWMRSEGWRGLRRKARQILVYWKFRALVRRAAALPPAPLPRESGAPWITILLSAWRTRPSWLLQAVESVRSQQFASWELCIGACELDESALSGLRKLAQEDPRIRVFELRENLGISGNTNALAREARGTFLAV